MQWLLCGVGVIIDACSGGVFVYDYLHYKFTHRNNGLSDDNYYTILMMMMITIMAMAMGKTTVMMMIASGNAQMPECTLP